MRMCVYFAILCCFTYSPVKADDKVDLIRAKALAQMQLLSANRDRVSKSDEQCLTDLKSAEEKAKKEGKTLVLWVGMVCLEMKEYRLALNDCVHCHLKEFDGVKEPHLVIVNGKDKYWFTKKSLEKDFDPKTVAAYTKK